MLNFWIPARSAGPALIALTRGRAAVEALVNNRGPMSPGVAGLRVVFCIR